MKIDRYACLLFLIAAISLNHAFCASDPQGVHLANFSASPSETNTTIHFNILGGPNFVPYDLLVTTNLANPQSQWTWLGLGYTSNQYVLLNQPSGLAFYLLAKPQKTMVVAWGNDTVSQCTIPYGLSNAVAVTGGGGQSLALLSDGSVRAWGQNYYDQASVPDNLAEVKMIAAGWYHNLALLSDGTVKAWGLNAEALSWNLTRIPVDLTNAIAVSAQALHSLALRKDGTISAWGYGLSGESTAPAGVSNTIAISAGYMHNLAVKADGTVIAWGFNGSGQCDVPSSLTNVVAVAAGIDQSVALKNDGTVVVWGGDEASVPPGLSNIVAIAAAGDPGTFSSYALALRKDGTVVAWGDGEVLNPTGLDNIIALAGGADHALAVRSGPPTPVITLQPIDQYQLAGKTVMLSSKGAAGSYAVTYQWQADGVNIIGETNAALTVSVQAQQSTYNVIVNNEFGSKMSSKATVHMVLPPIITSQTPTETNQTIVYGGNLLLGITVSNQSSAFPTHYQWLSNTIAISGATSSSYVASARISSPSIYTVIATNAAGATLASWQIATTFDGTYIAPGTLAYHLSTNAAGHALGYSPNASSLREVTNWSYGFYSASNANMHLLTNAVWSTNFWLHGVQGLSATAIGISNNFWGQALITMISPRHYLRATHTGVPPGTVAFLDTNNVIYWRSSIQQVDIGNDTSIGFLDFELPPSVGYLPVIPTNFSNYLPKDKTNWVQGIGMNQDLFLFGQPMVFGDPVKVFWNSSWTAPFGLGTNWNLSVRGGDSSNPDLLLITNQLVLVTHNWHSSDGPNYAYQFDAINQKMHLLSTNNSALTDYQLTPCSFTNWPVLNSGAMRFVDAAKPKETQ